uniref:2Fe-2S ferredoxin-type domain-containing protein n=1 Tax=Oxyrrhis marina TaxID=2969 RepID=A0A6U9L3Y5_OXYMA|mmetsp:Transcript_16993/g.40937  ORF Transcript_16993/g.40937 Transcript_16993/m.40937 type:complete len:115 (-) Transcript_16993:163-507(-)
MSSSETAMKLRIALLKYPKRAALQAQLQKVQPAQVRVQINNTVYTVDSRQTVLDVARKNKLKIPFNCRAGICGACEAKIDGEYAKTCYTIVKDGMHVVEKSAELQNWRQNCSDE